MVGSPRGPHEGGAATRGACTAYAGEGNDTTGKVCPPSDTPEKVETERVCCDGAPGEGGGLACPSRAPP